MNPTLRRFLTLLISLTLIVAPLRSGWARSFDSVPTDSPACHMVAGGDTVATLNGAIKPGDVVQSPCCRENCDGCDGNCDACSPMGAALISLPPITTFPASAYSLHADAVFEPVHPKPLLRPPPRLPG